MAYQGRGLRHDHSIQTTCEGGHCLFNHVDDTGLNFQREPTE